MFEDKRILGLVTARGGSKRLPGKNLLPFNGKPLISWTILAGLKSKYIDDLIVSTDNNEIAHASKKDGAAVPFLRPKRLAQDETSSIEVIFHTLKKMAELKVIYDYVFLLQPTSPLRSSDIIDNAIESLFKRNADSVIGVTKVNHPKEWINGLGEEGSMESFHKSLKDANATNDQYVINGAVYFCSVVKLIEQESLILDSNCYAYIMDNSSSIDIDYEHDFKIAETIAKELGN